MIGRQHPVFGFIYLDALDYNKVYSRLLTMRDNDLKNGINESGFPTGFESWCKDHLKELCAQTIKAIRNQACMPALPKAEHF